MLKDFFLFGKLYSIKLLALAAIYKSLIVLTVRKDKEKPGGKQLDFDSLTSEEASDLIDQAVKAGSHPSADFLPAGDENESVPTIYKHPPDSQRSKQKMETKIKHSDGDNAWLFYHDFKNRE